MKEAALLTSMSAPALAGYEEPPSHVLVPPFTKTNSAIRARPRQPDAQSLTKPRLAAPRHPVFAPTGRFEQGGRPSQRERTRPRGRVSSAYIGSALGAAMSRS